jgi:hypothetical protein
MMERNCIAWKFVKCVPHEVLFRMTNSRGRKGGRGSTQETGEKYTQNFGRETLMEGTTWNAYVCTRGSY